MTDADESTSDLDEIVQTTSTPPPPPLPPLLAPVKEFKVELRTLSSPSQAKGTSTSTTTTTTNSNNNNNNNNSGRQYSSLSASSAGAGCAQTLDHSGGPSQQAIASPNSFMMDDSTANGFITAQGTSDEDDESDEDDDDDEGEDDSRSNYSLSNQASNHANNNSNMSIMTNGSSNSGGGGGGGGGVSNSSNSRTARHAGGKCSTQINGEEKRSHHNVLERKRRDLLKDSFSKLRDSVPTTQPRERVSRAEILRHAADFISSTVQKNAAIRRELDELIRKNRENEERRKMAAASGPGASATATGVNSNLHGPTTQPSLSGTQSDGISDIIKQES